MCSAMPYLTCVRWLRKILTPWAPSCSDITLKDFWHVSRIHTVSQRPPVSLPSTTFKKHSSTFNAARSCQPCRGMPVLTVSMAFFVRGCWRSARGDQTGAWRLLSRSLSRQNSTALRAPLAHAHLNQVTTACVSPSTDWGGHAATDTTGPACSCTSWMTTDREALRSLTSRRRTHPSKPWVRFALASTKDQTHLRFRASCEKKLVRVEQWRDVSYRQWRRGFWRSWTHGERAASWTERDSWCDLLFECRWGPQAVAERCSDATYWMEIRLRSDMTWTWAGSSALQRDEIRETWKGVWAGLSRTRGFKHCVAAAMK